MKILLHFVRSIVSGIYKVSVIFEQLTNVRFVRTI